MHDMEVIGFNIFTILAYCSLILKKYSFLKRHGFSTFDAVHVNVTFLREALIVLSNRDVICAEAEND